MRDLLLALFLGLVLITPAMAQQAAQPAQPQEPPSCEDQLIGLRFGNGQLMQVNGQLQQESAQLQSQKRKLEKDLTDLKSEIAKAKNGTPAAAPKPETPAK